MKPADQDDLAICNAILPLIMSWRDLDSAVEVLSLDAEPNGLEILLAAQGITLSKNIDETHDGWSAITNLDVCDVLSPDDLKAWVFETLHRLKPGGLLVLGGTAPKDTAFRHDEAHTSPETAAQITHDAGFARARVILPELAPDDTSLHSALYRVSRKFAVVAQKHAFGKTFDAFSPGFLQISSLSASKRFKRAEEELYARIHSSEDLLNKRIIHLDTTFQAGHSALGDRINQAQATLRDQATEIAHLHNELEALRTNLKRATRRRGLRKLAYEIKKKLKPKPDVPSPSETASSSSTPETPAAGHDTRPTDRLPRKRDQTTPVSIDPVSLSTREIALRNRLFNEPET